MTLTGSQILVGFIFYLNDNKKAMFTLYNNQNIM